MTYSKIIDKVIEKGVRIYIQSTLYLSHFYPSMIDPITINREVSCLNEQLKELCSSRSLIFLDLNQTIAPYGYLNSELTSDGLHLNPEGYKIWSNAVVPLLV